MTFKVMPIAGAACLMLAACSSGEEAEEAAGEAEPASILDGEPTAGVWDVHNGIWGDFGPRAYFGKDYDSAVLHLACERGDNQIVLLREMDAMPTGDVPVRIVTASGEQEIVGGPNSVEVPNAGGTTAIEARFDLDDPLLDELAGESGSFAVAAGDSAPLVMPYPGGEIGFVLESCRQQAEE